MKVIAEGAEAAIYKTELGGIPAILKRRIQKKYRIAAMDTKIRAVRSKNEARIIATVSKAGINAPRLLLFDGYDVYMTAIEGRKLTEVIKSGGNWEVLFEKLGKMLALLHGAGVIHGDYTPANIIVGKEGPCVVDFGLSEMNNYTLEERAVDILLMKRSVARANYLSFVKGYKGTCSDGAEVFGRLEIVERRGRYQTRTLS